MNRLLLFLSLFCVQGLSAQQMSWITACADQNICLNQNSCTQGSVFLVEKAVTNCGSPLINYSYKIDLNNDNIVDIQSSADTVSGMFAKGTHKITWKATDNCANVIQCTYLFIVKDCQPPSLLCINGLTQGLDFPDCQESFYASQFVLSMSDNCTPTNQLKLGIRKAGDGTGFPTDTSLTFNSCEKGFNSIEVWVKDGNGLANLCSNYVILQDGNNDCVCNEDADVYFNGCARTGANNRLANFKLKTSFESLPGAAVPLTKSYSQTVTDSCYTLHLDKIPFGADYKATIRGERQTGPLVGVTTYDLVLVSKHILAIEPFTNIYQMLAADVNKSSSVTTFDILETRKLILGIYDTFPLVPAWRVIRAVADPSQVSNFSAIKDTYQITIPNLLDDRTYQNLDFIGIKYGDVNGSANFTDDPMADDRNAGAPLLLHAEDAWLEAGEIASVTLHLTKPTTLEGWQLALKTDPVRLQFLGLEGLPTDQFTLQEDKIKALWVDGQGQDLNPETSIITLNVKALQAVRISEVLCLDAESLRPEAYTPSVNKRTKRHELLLHFGAQADAPVVFFPPHPNPFSSETTFELMLENEANARLEVFDAQGKLVFTNDFQLEKGLQTLPLSGFVLPNAGVFAYRLSVGNAISRGRLIRI